MHVDVKKLAGIPDGGGWWLHGKGNAPPRASVGYRYICTAIDDRTRIAYSEIHGNEQGSTAAAGFWRRARRHFTALGVTVEEVLTDNGRASRPGRFGRSPSPTVETPAPLARVATIDPSAHARGTALAPVRV